MDAFLRDARRRPTIAAHLLTPSSLVALTVAWNAVIFNLLSLGWDARQVQGQVVELAVYFGVTAIWVGAHLLRFAGAGAGAGLRLAAAALVARIACETYVGILFQPLVPVYRLRTPVGPWVWFMRNVGLAVFAYGLALTLFAVAVDAHRRRRHPAWVASLED